jgi:parallel beta-helix repeat protein
MLPPTIINNTIAGNTSMSSSGGGGGIYIMDRPALIQGNTISDNQATSNDGGGIYLTGKTTTQVLGNWVLRNKADDDGGGVLVRSSGIYFANNMVADNQADSEGSGIFIHGSSPRLLHTTIARNSSGDGSGVHVTDWSGTNSIVEMTNTILVSHAVGIKIAAGNIATLTATLWGTAAWVNDQDWGGDGSAFVGSVNVWGDPAFVNPDEGDYHIGLNSAAIDEGVETAVNNDIDGDLRPQCGCQDIGADEINCVYLPIIMKNRS